jgi:Ca-activated chloride channel family protein
MIFRYPWLLLLLLAIPPLLYLRHGRAATRPALRFSDGGALSRAGGGWGVRLRWLRPALYAVGLALVVVAMARPQKGLGESRIHTEAVDIVLLLDISPSMAAEDMQHNGQTLNRLDAAKRVIERFVKSRRDDRLGLVAFAALPYSVSPLTLDHGWLLTQMERLRSGDLGDGTAIGTALASAVNRLRDSKARSKVVVLLTDGVNNSGELSPENAAQAAQALDIKVYTVGAGTEGVVRMPVQDPFGGRQYVRQRSEIDEQTLRAVAQATGARYFRAEDFDALDRVYREIDALEKTEIEVEQYTRYEERFPRFVWLALGCLGLEVLLAFTRLGRVP